MAPLLRRPTFAAPKQLNGPTVAPPAKRRLPRLHPSRIRRTTAAVEPMRGLAGEDRREHGGQPVDADGDLRRATSRSRCSTRTAAIINQHLAQGLSAARFRASRTSWRGRWSEALRRHPGDGRVSYVAHGRQAVPPARLHRRSIIGLADRHRGAGRRSATLMVPNVKNCRRDELRAVSSMPTTTSSSRARGGKLDGGRLPGDTTCTLTNPGHDRDGELAAAPDGPGQSFILATGAIAVPAAVPGRIGSDNPDRARCQQGDDGHEHLRPPRHPGRRVGGVPGHACIALLTRSGSASTTAIFHDARSIPHRPLRTCGPTAAPRHWARPQREIENMQSARRR